jgi:hypothetical protein
VQSLPAARCRHSLSVTPRGHSRRAPSLPLAGGGASHNESGRYLPAHLGGRTGAPQCPRGVIVSHLCCKSLRTCCICVLDMLQLSHANVSKIGLNFLMLRILIFDAVEDES